MTYAWHFWQILAVDGSKHALSTFSFILVDLRERTIWMAAKLRILRMMLSRERPRNNGRIVGRQAPTTPREDSTIGQYTVGVRMSFSD